ncbi:unnamed protein product [Dibothriocephalus latus]|uniref:Uncharacterized protein n=1 Tax=Dibothriocephalus latus TaxID=60516 RepID=A0A3P7MXI4_DIBLA|nr:unnamed protein product [Dibothriocephalus latus]
MDTLAHGPHLYATLSSGHIFKFDEAEIPARGDNRVSRELLVSWFSGPQFISKRNDLAFPYGVRRNFLSKRIIHVGRTGRNNNSDDSGPNCRAIIKPASDADKDAVAINEQSPHQLRPRAVATETDNYSTHADDRYDL